MKTGFLLRRWWLLLLLACSCAPAARAGVNFTLEFQRIRQPAAYGGLNLYVAYPSLGADGGSVPLTSHLVFGPVTNHFSFLGTNFGGSSTAVHYELADLVGALSGTWTLVLNQGHPTAQTNRFTVSFAGLTSNAFPAAVVYSPAEGALNLPPNFAYHWTGPANWTELDVNVHSEDFSWYEFSILPPAGTNWPAAPPALGGTNIFVVNYRSNNTPFTTISIPTNAANGQPLAGWAGASKIASILETWFTVTVPPDPPAQLRAHLNFDNPVFAGEDTSGQGNHILSSSWCAGGPPGYSSSGGVAGGAMIYNGTNWHSLNSNLVPVLASNFSISLWVKTTGTYGSDTDPAFAGAGLLSAANYLPPGNQTIPLALTGSKLAFTTSDPGSSYDTLHSTSDINTGAFVHVVVTRAQASGRMSLYVNGVLEDSALNNTALYTNFTSLVLGHRGDCAHGVPSTIDEVQIYSGVLNSNQVAFLYANPTLTAPISFDIGEAVDAPQLTWNTGGTEGGAPWFGQTNTTYDGVDAAQSGALEGFQSSFVETLVQGPGVLEFQWQMYATNFDYLEFYIDGNYQAYIDGENGWWSETFNIPGGAPRMLRWEYWADDSAAGNSNRAWLDQVTFTPLPPVDILTLSNTSAGFQFGFLTSDGFDHLVQYRDDLTNGVWLPYTNIAGTGGIFTVIQPATNIQKRFFRVLTQ